MSIDIPLVRRSINEATCRAITAGLMFLCWGMIPLLPLMAQNDSVETTEGSSEARTESGESASSWALDKIRLADGRMLSGLMDAESPMGVVFLEVRREPGKQMSLCLHMLAGKDFTSVETLTPLERAALRQRIESVRHRAEIEADLSMQVPLVDVRADGIEAWRYDGADFLLEASLDSEETRRLVVRLRQVLMALKNSLTHRAQLPARTRRLSVRVVGDLRRFVLDPRAQGRVAYFDANANEIGLGSNLGRFKRELASLSARHDGLLNDLQRREAELPDQLKKWGEQLKESGKTPQEIRKSLSALAVTAREEIARERERIQKAQRDNESIVDDVRQRLTERLYHEAVHAFLEQTLPHPGRLPMWFNEGTAQVFESALLEADTLRVDAPESSRLLQLQEELLSDDPLPLSELLLAPAETFRVGHGGKTTTSERYYLYAWGLAYYLLFVRADLPAIELFSQLSGAAGNPIARFESAVDAPLKQFEDEWRNAVLFRLRPHSRE